ncbi:MAG: hypothetical protein ACXVZZ_07470 [Terriglobales bacterium]
MPSRALNLLLLLAALVCVSVAQTPNLEPASKEPNLPIVSFDFAFPGSTPSHYSIAVEPDGKATYRSDEVAAAGSAPLQPYLHQFMVSEPTRKQIFDLALGLNCFQGNFEYHGGARIANTGTKTLKCTYADRESQTTYNYSPNSQLQTLTALFQNMSNTLEAGRRLEYLHRYDKLGLEAELKSAEELEKNKRLGELQAIAPQLELVLNDSSVMNVSRRRAERLLQRIKADPAARAAAPQ